MFFLNSLYSEKPYLSTPNALIYNAKGATGGAKWLLS